mmetsp:Transcript_67853/g.198542  ORF Transcript_67853/g.198542 Transcript_67853/m.198542 type:complete len:250 (+) Transcript_67853:37-786(+)
MAMRRTSGLLFAKKGHSPQWIQRHVSDKYVQRAQENDYRSRSAFKLRQLDGQFSFLGPRATVVDLGCSAGGWSQVALERTATPSGRRSSVVVGVDKVHMEPLDYHHFIRGDVQDAITLAKVKEILQRQKATVVLSDMAPKMTGSKIDDHVASVDLCRAAARFAEQILKEGGWFVTKIFAGALADRHRGELEQRFRKVHIVKPKASREESRELYYVCAKFLGVTLDLSQDAAESPLYRPGPRRPAGGSPY